MSDPRSSRRQLWLIAQRFLCELFALFGAPEAIAARHTILRGPWRQMLTWLRAGEALMRQILLIEAAALPKPNTRITARKPRARVRKLMGFNADAPDAWRVSFRVFLDRRRPRRRVHVNLGHLPARTPAVQDTRFHSAWPLAERMEALMRVFNNPAPYAGRLARRLYATPHRARELRLYPEDTRAIVGVESFAHVCAEAERAEALLNSS